VRFLISAFSILAIASCSLSPYKQEAYQFDRVDIETEAIELKHNYLARYMMKTNTRSELISEIKDSDLIKDWTHLDTSRSLLMTSDLLTSQGAVLPGSLGIALSIGNLIWGEIDDDAMVSVSQAFLPAQFNGQLLDTEEKANKVLMTFTENHLEEIVESIGWGIKCIAGCDEMSRVYSITLNQNNLDLFLYRPEGLCAKVHVLPMKAVTANDPISAFVGFPAQWKTPDGNTYMLEFYSNCKKNSDGVLQTTYNETEKLHYPLITANSRIMHRTLIGRDLLKRFHSTPYTYFGTQQYYPSTFYYNKKVFAFSRNTKADMMDDYITFSSIPDKLDNN
jgi:hypothetical protein